MIAFPERVFVFQLPQFKWQAQKTGRFRQLEVFRGAVLSIFGCLVDD